MDIHKLSPWREEDGTGNETSMRWCMHCVTQFNLLSVPTMAHTTLSVLQACVGKQDVGVVICVLYMTVWASCDAGVMIVIVCVFYDSVGKL